MEAVLGDVEPTDRTGGHDLGLVHRHPRPCNRASSAAPPRRAVSRSPYRASMTGIRQPPATMPPDRPETRCGEFFCAV